MWELGEGHRRAASATLLLLDEALCTCEQWARGRECHSVLYSERNTLSSQQKRDLLAEIQEMRVLLDELRRELALKEETNTAASAIFQQVLATRDAVVELKSKHLRGYGELPRRLPEWLDPRLEDLVLRLNRLTQIARGEDTPGRNRKQEKQRET